MRGSNLFDVIYCRSLQPLQSQHGIWISLQIPAKFCESVKKNKRWGWRELRLDSCLLQHGSVLGLVPFTISSLHHPNMNDTILFCSDDSISHWKTTASPHSLWHFYFNHNLALNAHVKKIHSNIDNCMLINIERITEYKHLAWQQTYI